MAALSANPAVPVNAQRRPTTKTYVVKTAEVIYDSALVGVDSNGDLVAWADTAGHKFVGLSEGGAVTGNDAASVAVRANVRDDGPILYGVDVANVTDRNSIGAFVYCSTDNTADLTTTATSNVKAVGRLIDWRSNSDMDVRLFTPAEHLNVPLTADITTLTDSTGDSGTHDDTLAAVTENNAITDNSGGVDPGDDTIAAVTNQSTLTDNGAGTADATVEDVADIALSTSNTYTDAAVNTAVNTAIASISNNFKEYTTEQAKQVTANTAILAAIAQLAAKVNVNTTAIGVLKQNSSDTAQKIIEIVAALNVN